MKEFVDEKRSLGGVVCGEKVRKMVYQLIGAVAEIHEKRVIHRDIKPANILMDGQRNHSFSFSQFNTW